MPIKVTCPKCQGVLHAPDDAGGKRGKCPTCGTVLHIPADGPHVAGPPTAEPAYRSAADSREDTPSTQRSSFGAIPRPADVERKAPPPAPGRMPPPPAYAPPEPKKLADPFAKTGRRPALGVPGDGLVRAWRRTRAGLGWVRLALFLFLIAVLGYAGIAIAEQFGTKLPSENPGYLKIDGLPTDREIKWAVLLVPAALGLLLCTLGRFGVSNAPRSSFARGLATMAAVASLLVLLGVIAIAVPTGAQVGEGFVPQEPLPADNPNGIAQRVGLVLVLVFGVLAEIWFVSALGRMGAALHDSRLAARATRLSVFAGLVVAAVAIYFTATYVYPRDVQQATNEYVQPYWDKLADQEVSDGKVDFNYKPAAQWGLVGLAGLLAWLMYTRLVGAGRRAIREWLDQNEPAR